jgi:hypothetical protein
MPLSLIPHIKKSQLISIANAKFFEILESEIWLILKILTN